MSEHGPEVFDEDEGVVASKAWDGSLLLRLWSFARPHRAQFFASLAVLAALFALQLAGPWILRSAVDGPIRSAAAEVGASRPVASEHLAGLALFGALYLLVALLQTLLSYLEVAQLGRRASS